MKHRGWVLPILIAVLLAMATFSLRVRKSTETVAHQCVDIYAEGLPRNVRVQHVRQDGPELIVYVHHLDWAGEIRCALYRDGSLDEVEMENRKIQVHWSEPPMPSNP